MFFDVGGFNPLFGPSEEIELCGRIALRGDLANTSANVVRMLRGEGWSTTVNYSLTTKYNRWARDIALSQPSAFGRMLASANSGYWYGRIFQAYMSTMLWNLRRKALFAAMSRATFGLLSFALAGRFLTLADFWQAVKDNHVPCSSFHVLKYNDPALAAKR